MTQGPWDFTSNPKGEGYVVYSTKGMEPTVAVVERLEDARNICELPRLIKALKYVAACTPGSASTSALLQGAVEEAKAALAELSSEADNADT